MLTVAVILAELLALLSVAWWLFRRSFYPEGRSRES